MGRRGKPEREERPASADQAFGAKEIGLHFQSLGAKYQMCSLSPSCVPRSHQGWFSPHVSFLEPPGSRSDLGICAVLEADIMGTLSLRKTKKSFMGRRKIPGEPLGKRAQNLTVRQKQGGGELGV